ncbi:DUF222 domain-containing protein [Knoellia sp. LjRoot47]|uniref:HNH endonuclease signature motif containing protein n=1 Tax=Knoellia sp. LjRoot47 TaxID=3342330 RepID=UPI003ECD9DFD
MEATSASAAHEGRHAVLRGEVAGLTTEELLDVIEAAQRDKDAASARQALALAHLSAREPHLQEDGTTVEVHHGVGYQRMDAPELAAPRMGVSVHVASRRVSQAIDQLTRTPAVVDAMACGDLDERRAAAVTEETEFLSPESAAAVVGLVAPRWAGLTVGPLRQLLARAAAIIDPEAVAAHADDERSRRGLTRRTGSHGTDAWRGEFLVEQSRTAWAAITELARRKVRDGTAPTLELARADALMELVLDHCDVAVVVHTTRAADDPGSASMTQTARDDAGRPADATAGSAGGSDADAGLAAPSCTDGLMEVGGLGAPGTTFVPRAWVDDATTSTEKATRRDRELVCDPDTGALVAGDVPEALATGRTRPARSRRAEEPTPAYRIPDGMARLVRLRDGGCRFPGCSTPARQCDLDHVRPWPTGPTSPSNLIALCRHHHRIKQRPGWTVHLHPDGRVTWHDPTAHASTTWPVDHLHLATATHPSAPHPTAPGNTTPGNTPTTAPTTPAPATFEDELAALLDHEAIPLTPRTRPKVWDARGHLLTGPLPRTDSTPGHLTHHTTGRHHTLTLDTPHRSTRAKPDPEAIPF